MVKKTIEYLYDQNKESGILLDEDIDYKFSLKSPKFVYEIMNNTINRLRQNLKLKTEDILSFWEKHISYKLVKPIHKEYLYDWIRVMFYNTTFLEAYSTTSRTMMTMRLSTYSKTKIISEKIEMEDFEKKEYILRKKILKNNKRIY